MSAGSGNSNFHNKMNKIIKLNFLDPKSKRGAVERQRLYNSQLMSTCGVMLKYFLMIILEMDYVKKEVLLFYGRAF